MEHTVKSCSICEKPIRARGLCATHHQIARRNGWLEDTNIVEKVKNYKRKKTGIIGFREKLENRRINSCLICGDKHFCRGMCTKHYAIAYKKNWYKNTDAIERVKSYLSEEKKL